MEKKNNEQPMKIDDNRKTTMKMDDCNGTIY